jgi:hypothetical protein
VSEGSGRAMRRTSRRRKQVGRHGARAAQQAAAATLRPPPPNPPLQCQFDYNADQDISRVSQKLSTRMSGLS